jgi:hypothetical protein
VSPTARRLVRAIQSARLSRSDLAAIDAALTTARASVPADLDTAPEPPSAPVVTTVAAPRWVGSYWLELKYIPDRSGQWEYGPYLYARWREGGRQRSRYIGKRPPTSTDPAQSGTPRAAFATCSVA